MLVCAALAQESCGATCLDGPEERCSPERPQRLHRCRIRPDAGRGFVEAFNAQPGVDAPRCIAGVLVPVQATAATWTGVRVAITIGRRPGRRRQSCHAPTATADPAGFGAPAT